MKQQYRIRTWRHDEPESTHSEFITEGETIEECEKKAELHFDEVSNMPENAWEGMRLVRIDSPAVQEKSTRLKENGRQNNND